MSGKEGSLGKAGFTVSLYRGPFQNNGASPWYSQIQLGTSTGEQQILKFSFDTGSDFIWVTSTLCGDGCLHYGGDQFNYSDSSTFEWVSTLSQKVDFGPWGSMKVKTGSDVLALNTTLEKVIQQRSDIYLSECYSGVQFAELDWDGGIGLPSITNSTQVSSNSSVTQFASYRGQERVYNNDSDSGEQAMFGFFNQLISDGFVDPQSPYVCFDTDVQSCTDNAKGYVSFGELDPSYKDSLEYVFFPWKPYPLLDVPYLWTTPLSSVTVGDCEKMNIEGQLYFALDSGSSQFKGDKDLMTALYDITTLSKQDVTLTFDLDEVGTVDLVVPSDLYDVEIEAGENQGEIISQFAPLDGVKGLVLVGSVLMDYLYTVYEYKVNSSQDIEPVGMWIFNKHNGPKVIKNKQATSARIFNTDKPSN